jgi:selenocysteine lyase/cysteine desulfurase
VLGCDDSQGAVDALAKENIVVSARGAGIRISFHYYNLADDVDEVFQVLDRRPDLMSH